MPSWLYYASKKKHSFFSWALTPLAAADYSDFWYTCEWSRDDVGIAVEGWRKVPWFSKVKYNCHRTAPLASHSPSSVTTPTISFSAFWRCASPIVSGAQRTKRSMQDSWIAATSSSLDHCVYETSHGTGRAQRNNRKAITSGNITGRFYSICVSTYTNISLLTYRNWTSSSW